MSETPPRLVRTFYIKSALLVKKCQLLDMMSGIGQISIPDEHEPITPVYPKTNSLVENFNKNIVKVNRTAVVKKHW